MPFGVGLSDPLTFGALISPTDPIAVIGILKSTGAPKNLELVIAGESVFNDGVGVVLFSLLVEMLVSDEAPTIAHGARLLLQEAGGGLLFGLAIGDVTFRLLRSIDNYQVEVMLTLAAVMGGYALASTLHVSGPLAMVVAGLVIGNQGRSLAMSTSGEPLVAHVRTSGGLRSRAHLGRSAWRNIGSVVSFASARSEPRGPARHDVLRGRVLHPGSRPDDRRRRQARDPLTNRDAAGRTAA